MINKQHLLIFGMNNSLTVLRKKLFFCQIYFQLHLTFKIRAHVDLNFVTLVLIGCR